MVPNYFNPAQLLAHQARASRLPGAAALADRLAADLLDRLADFRRSFTQVATCGLPSPAGDALAAKVTELRLLTLADLLADRLLPLPEGGLDLILVHLGLHWVNDLPGVLWQLRRALRPDGLLLASLVGGDSLHELRASLLAADLTCYGGAWQRTAPLTTIRDAGMLLQRAGFALPVTDTEPLLLTYPHLPALVADLRAFGATLPQPGPRPASRRFWAAVAAHYQQHYALADGRLPATLEIIQLAGHAPAATQQQPLARGTAKKRLADVLRTCEEDGGEPAG